MAEGQERVSRIPRIRGLITRGLAAK
jgi:hypothetical protein